MIEEQYNSFPKEVGEDLAFCYNQSCHCWHFDLEMSQVYTGLVTYINQYMRRHEINANWDKIKIDISSNKIWDYNFLPYRPPLECTYLLISHIQMMFSRIQETSGQPPSYILISLGNQPTNISPTSEGRLCSNPPTLTTT